MRSLHIPMTWEEWKRLPWRFGWKHEYWDEHAHLTPRQDHACVRFGLRPGPRAATVSPADLSARPMEPADAPELVRAFIETFEDGIEFCDWPSEKVHEQARRNIRLLRRRKGHAARDGFAHGARLAGGRGGAGR